MRLDEVAELYKRIKKQYPWFDASINRVREDHSDYLHKFPFETAMENVKNHILTEPQPPTIAHIRGRQGELMEAKRSKESASAHMANLDSASKSNIPPPIGYWENLRSKIRGDA
ncbi:hypothetical protein [Cohnella cholangitidis]|uniref:Replicative helicase inhibitor G39P N-terminal domain-containing protein n=1 Tax=Cohnella cholangitidis TaxID=2598458 RepID=A0A7G5C3D7_9BACL|nr:hypothetical protein [Cohnella cholangitidis]QMV43721.1 hypothetical protein FPL14_23020 [Cohnella cholangitidis]